MDLTVMLAQQNARYVQKVSIVQSRVLKLPGSVRVESTQLLDRPRARLALLGTIAPQAQSLLLFAMQGNTAQQGHRSASPAELATTVRRERQRQ